MTAGGLIEKPCKGAFPTMNDSKDHDRNRRASKSELLRQALARQAQFVIERIKRRAGGSADEDPKK
jgi:hypothetical protein